MKNHRLAACLLLAVLCAPARAGIQGAYFAVIVADADVAAGWYRSVFGLGVANRMTEPDRYDIVILENEQLIVELLELEAAVERPEGRVTGLFKTGFLVDDLAAFAAALPNHVPPPDILDDADNGLLLLQLRDPDGNIVQVMQPIRAD